MTPVNELTVFPTAEDAEYAENNLENLDRIKRIRKPGIWALSLEAWGQDLQSRDRTQNINFA